MADLHHPATGGRMPVPSDEPCTGWSPDTGQQHMLRHQLPRNDGCKLALRDAFGQFPTGVTLVTTRTAEGEDVGITINSFTSVSLDPPKLLWNLRLTSRNWPTFAVDAPFAVNVLAREQRQIAEYFATFARNQFDVAPMPLAFRRGIGGVPLLNGAVAHFQCITEQRVRAGDHGVLIGSVEAFEAFSTRAPLAFWQGRYVGLGVNEAGPGRRGGADDRGLVRITMKNQCRLDESVSLVTGARGVTQSTQAEHLLAQHCCLYGITRSISG